MADRHEEQAPLLGPRKRTRRSRVSSVVCTALVVIGSLLLAFTAFGVLLGASFWPSKAEIDSLQSTAFRYSTTPERLNIVNISEDGVLVELTVRCGIDADRAMGVGLSRAQAEHAAKMGYRGAGADWWERIRAWSVDQMRGHVPSHVHIDVLEPIRIRSNGTVLATVDILTPLHVPIVQRASGDWLEPMPLMLLAKPVATMDAIWAFIQHGWETEQVKVTVAAAAVRGMLPRYRWSLERAIELPVSVKRKSPVALSR